MMSRNQHAGRFSLGYIHKSVQWVPNDVKIPDAESPGGGAAISYLAAGLYCRVPARWGLRRTPGSDKTRARDPLVR